MQSDLKVKNLALFLYDLESDSVSEHVLRTETLKRLVNESSRILAMQKSLNSTELLLRKGEKPSDRKALVNDLHKVVDDNQIEYKSSESQFFDKPFHERLN